MSATKIADVVPVLFPVRKTVVIRVSVLEARVLLMNIEMVSAAHIGKILALTNIVIIHHVPEIAIAMEENHSPAIANQSTDAQVVPAPARLKESAGPAKLVLFVLLAPLIARIAPLLLVARFLLELLFPTPTVPILIVLPLPAPPALRVSILN